MPTYKGNVGNLMQHWILCELVRIAHDRRIPGLNFIDAHAMAPLARTKDNPDGRFNRVEARVQQPHDRDHQWASTYEMAWHHLAPCRLRQQRGLRGEDLAAQVRPIALRNRQANHCGTQAVV